jgi:hypothetical protein
MTRVIECDLKRTDNSLPKTVFERTPAEFVRPKATHDSTVHCVRENILLQWECRSSPFGFRPRLTLIVVQRFSENYSFHLQSDCVLTMIRQV